MLQSESLGQINSARTGLSSQEPTCSNGRSRNKVALHAANPLPWNGHTQVDWTQGTCPLYQAVKNNCRKVKKDYMTLKRTLQDGQTSPKTKSQIHTPYWQLTSCLQSLQWLAVLFPCFSIQHPLMLENTSVRYLTSNKELLQRHYTPSWVSECMQKIKVNSFSILFSFPAHDPSAAKYLSTCFKLCPRNAFMHMHPCPVLFRAPKRSAEEG